MEANADIYEELDDLDIGHAVGVTHINTVFQQKHQVHNNKNKHEPETSKKKSSSSGNNFEEKSEVGEIVNQKQQEYETTKAKISTSQIKYDGG